MTTPAPTLQNQLKAALREQLATFTEPQTLISFTIPVEPIDLIDWLSAQPAFPKLYWQARNSVWRYAGVGAALTIGSAQRKQMNALTQEQPEAAFFGGMRFDTTQPASTEWRSFENSQFVLPRFVMEQNDSGVARLRYNLLIDSSSAINVQLAGLDAEIEGLLLDTPSVKPQATVHANVEDIPNAQTWMESVRKITGRIKNNTIEKVVLARRVDLNFSEPPNPFLFMRHFHAMNSPAFYFCFQLSPDKAFVGSSPECLFQRAGDSVASEALAGTRRRGATPEEDEALRRSLQTSTKDLHEHQLVADHVQEVLRPLCKRLETDASPSLLQLVLVQHLLSSTKGQLLNTTSDQDLIQALHPTPAVGGVPTQDALACIRELEPFDRGWYAAPFGRISRDEVELTVAIRSGLLHGNTLSLYCGAGIVGASDPESEWEETESKFANFLHVIHVE
jgi:menaquinone-specific isochorismate synthase